MKKDKLWAKIKVQEELESWIGVEGGIDEDGINYVLNIIDQLDEPEVLSQGWIDEHKVSRVNNLRKMTMSDVVPVDELQDLLVPKQELPVIPKYVGDWITKYRKVFELYPALKKIEDSPLIWERIYKWYRVNTYKFVNVYLTGEYEVEEEPLYQALVKGHELMGSGDTYWIYDKSDDSVLISKLYRLSNYFLTEMSKEDWNKLGINDSNSEFVKVDD